MVRIEAPASMAKAAGNNYSPHLQLPHQGSTLPAVVAHRSQDLRQIYTENLRLK
jgi:hypothetical protein